ncbi:HAD family phosphatase [Candidatus Uhrbacteria bacterium]|nr:HAD family phosphatase [Candidatus Uhrbacteria bacterium]
MGGEGKDPIEGLTPAVFFDLDGTWLRWQLFDEWIKEMIRLDLFPEVVYALTRESRQAYLNREGKFSDWVWKQVEAYTPFMRGVRVSDAKFAAHEVIREKGRRVHVFVRCLSQAAKETGMRRAIISGSPSVAVEAFAEANGINIFLGTEHEDREGVYTGSTTKEWARDKSEAVSRLAGRYGINLDCSVAVGDSYSDRLMLELVRYPICFNPEKKLRDLALERGWLIVVEKKDCFHIYRLCGDGQIRFVHLGDYLPWELARVLEAKLAGTDF